MCNALLSLKYVKILKLNKKFWGKGEMLKLLYFGEYSSIHGMQMLSIYS